MINMFSMVRVVKVVVEPRMTIISFSFVLLTVVHAWSSLHKFDTAYAFNQDLCSWGPLMFGNTSNTVSVSKMFTGSACPNTKSPVNGTVGEGGVPQNFCSAAKCRLSSMTNPTNTGSPGRAHCILHNIMLSFLSCAILLNSI